MTLDRYAANHLSVAIRIALGCTSRLDFGEATIGFDYQTTEADRMKRLVSRYVSTRRTDHSPFRNASPLS
jgi:hypothetical protein